MRHGNFQHWKKWFIAHWAIVSLVVILSIAFFPIIFQGRTLSSSSVTAGVMGMRTPWGSETEKQDYNVARHYPDAGAFAWQDEPMAEKTSRMYADGLLPLWNSSMGLGKPLAAEMQSAVFFPLKTIVYLFPNPIGWDILFLFRIFIAMALTYIFLRLLNIGRMGSTIGAVVFGLNGYFMLFIQMPHLNVEILLPLACISFELIVRKVQYGWLVLSAAIFLLITGGHPEADIIVMICAMSFFIYRLLWVRNRWQSILHAIIGCVVGLGVSSVLVVPFFELFQLAYTSHTVESLQVLRTDPAGLFFHILFPYVLGQPLDPWVKLWGDQSGTRFWIGVLPTFFILISLWGSKRWKSSLPIFILLFFFGITKQFGLLQYYDWIQRVPIVNLITFQKYLVPLTVFAAAVLTAFGVEYLWTTARQRLTPLIVSAAVLGITPLFLGKYYVAVSATVHMREFKEQFLWLGALIIVVLIGVVVQEYTKKVYPTVIIVLAVLAVAELISLVPKDWSKRVDPFTTPPYIQFLQEKSKDRIFATDYLLYPGTATAFDLYDIRDLDAVFVEHYIRYIQEFINISVVDRYTGMPVGPENENEPTRFANNPFFDLLNVRYVISKEPIVDAASFMESLLKENEGVNWPGIELRTFTIDGDTRPVIFQHPGAGVDNSVKKKITPQSTGTVLQFAPAMDSSVWEKEGDGVQFSIYINNESTPVYDEWIDPKHKVEQRMWNNREVSLGKYQGQEIVVEFRTTMGANNTYDFAGWGGLSLVEPNMPAEQSQYTVVYNDEVAISENTHAYPRAFLVSAVSEKQSDEEVIAAMHDPQFDPRSVAVVKTDEELNLKGNEVIPFESSTITHYTDHTVTIETHAPQPALLILSDTYYPGWKATVDGEVTTIYQTDLALRGVLVPQGQHVVTFTYSPWSVTVGWIITTITIISVAVWVVRKELVIANPKLQQNVNV